MQIDTNTLKQLDIFGHKEESLNIFFKHTYTQVGTAILNFELCHPLIQIDAIQERQRVFSFLNSNSDFINECKQILNQNKTHINKFSTILGQILKFKNSGINKKEPCLFENVVLKRMQIIKNFLNVLILVEKTLFLLSELQKK